MGLNGFFVLSFCTLKCVVTNRAASANLLQESYGVSLLFSKSFLLLLTLAIMSISISFFKSSADLCKALRGSAKHTGNETLVISYLTSLESTLQTGTLCPTGRIYGNSFLCPSLNIAQPLKPLGYLSSSFFSSIWFSSF